MLNKDIDSQMDVESGKQWRYSELRIVSENCAKRLAEIGVKRNSRCALITSTTARAIFIHFACSILDAVLVCINGNQTAGRYSHSSKYKAMLFNFERSNFINKFNK